MEDTDRKVLATKRGERSAKDLKSGIKLSWAPWCYMSADLTQGYWCRQFHQTSKYKYYHLIQSKYHKSKERCLFFHSCTTMKSRPIKPTADDWRNVSVCLCSRRTPEDSKSSQYKSRWVLKDFYVRQTANINCDIFIKYVWDGSKRTVKMSLVITGVKFKCLKSLSKGERKHYTFTCDTFQSFFIRLEVIYVYCH